MTLSLRMQDLVSLETAFADSVTGYSEEEKIDSRD